MVWSKLKKRVELMFADSLRHRVCLSMVIYRKSHDEMFGRGIIMVDKEEIWDCDTCKYFLRTEQLADEIRQINNCSDYKIADKYVDYIEAYREADEIVKKEGAGDQHIFYQAIKKYVNMNIEEILNSDNVLILALGIIDRRVGKRRLPRLEDKYSTHKLLKYMYKLRVYAEKLK